jgi:hypothetical protein
MFDTLVKASSDSNRLRFLLLFIIGLITLNVIFNVHNKTTYPLLEASSGMYNLGCEAPVRIMPLGDSITYGSGEITDPNLTTGYRQHLHQLLIEAGYNIDFVGDRQNGKSVMQPFDPDHQGSPGFTAYKIAINVYDYLTANPADIVLLHIGSNDMGSSFADTGRILDEIHRYSPEIIVIVSKIINSKGSRTISESNTNLERIVLERINHGEKIILVDQDQALSYPDDIWNNSHPADSGYRKMAVVWFEALTKILPLCTQSSPFIYSRPLTETAEGQPYEYRVGAVGKPVPHLVLLEAPAGMKLDGATGTISLSPEYSGSFTVRVEARNDMEKTGSQTFTLHVLPENIIDNSDPLRTFHSGEWMTSSATGPIGSDSFYGYNGATFSWVFTPERSGDYEVFVWWAAWPSRSHRILYVIEHSDGRAGVVQDQSRNEEQWNTLGKYKFQAGTSYGVTVASQSYPSTTCADAVKFEYLSSGIHQIVRSAN